VADKLDIFEVLKAIDSKDYGFYDRLSDEKKKSFSAFLSMKWASAVKGDTILQHYYLASINNHTNVNLFDISKHPKLQWLLLVAASPNFGVHRHEWISTKKEKETKSSKDIKGKLMEIYPQYKKEDIEILSKFVTKKDLKEYEKQSGNL